MNWIPARINWLLTAVCAWLLPGYSGAKALRVGWRQHALMPGQILVGARPAPPGHCSRIVGQIWHGHLVTELWLGDANDRIAGDRADVGRTIILLSVTGFGATALALIAISTIHL